MSIEFQEEKAPDEEEEKLLRVTPVVPYFSYILTGCIVAVAAVQAISGFEVSSLIAGFYKEAFRDYGEYWRILTGIAVHGGIAHIAFNGYALYMLGRLVETISNRAHLATVFLLSGIGGCALSLFASPSGLSVGASGGIIGLLGYLTIYGFYRRKLMSSAFLKNMVFNIVFIGALGVIFLPLIGNLGLKDVPKVDNFGHLGGLLAGAIYGIVQIPRDLYQDPRQTSEFSSIVGYASLGIFIFVSILTILLILRIISF